MAEIVRRRSWGGVLPLGRHVSISGSRSIHAPSVSIAPSSFQEEQNARHHKQFKREQALGFEIEAIRKLLALQAAPDASCAQARAVTQAHVEAINTKVKQLLWMKEWLLRVIELCPSDASIDDCPILKAMACGTDHYAASTYCSK